MCNAIINNYKNNSKNIFYYNFISNTNFSPQRTQQEKITVAQKNLSRFMSHCGIKILPSQFSFQRKIFLVGSSIT